MIKCWRTPDLPWDDTLLVANDTLIVAPVEGNVFGRYEAQRCGLRWRVVFLRGDGIRSPLYLGKFWRRMTALRIAQALMIAELHSRP